MKVKASAMVSNKPKDLGGTFKRLYGFIRPYRFSFFCAIILSILSAVFHTLSPYILGIATDTIINGTAASLPIKMLLANLSKVLLLLAVTYVIFSVAKYFSVIIIANVSQKTMFDMRSAVDDKLKKIPLKYFDSNSYGDILSRVTNDVDTVSTSLQQSIEQMISSITSLIFIFTMMIIVSPELTLVGLVTIPFTMLASFMVIKKSQKFFKGQQASLGDLNGYVEEMINGHTIIKAFGKEEQTVNEFNKINNQLYTHAWKAQFMSGLMMPISQFFTNIGYVAVVVIGGFMIINGNFSIGKIQSFIQYLRQFSMPITQTAQIATILQSTAAAAERIFEFLDEQEEPAEVKDKKFPQNPKGEVTIEHVRFGYSQDKILIKDLSIHVKSGDKVAIVGPTGAGKTTLVNLLMRFYDTLDGTIKIDNINIMDMGREELRTLFGMVLQDTWLFNGTVMENIRYGRLDATDEDVYNAAIAAHADSFIKMLPNGYNMVLSENGSNLAGGEKQLLTIARAILASPTILILDEATSSVDTRTEVAIQNAMLNLMKNRTSFVIAHRLSTIRDADMILFMHDGDIKETGNHKDLLNKGGYYAALYNSQFAENNLR